MKLSNKHDYFNGLCYGCDAAVKQLDVDPDSLYKTWLCGRCRAELEQLPPRHKIVFDRLKSEMDKVSAEVAALEKKLGGAWEGPFFKKKEESTGLDPLKPSNALLVKLGSIAVHVDEMLPPKGHEFDKAALDTLLNDEEVKVWIRQMSDMAFLPVKR